MGQNKKSKVAKQPHLVECLWPLGLPLLSCPFSSLLSLSGLVCQLPAMFSLACRAMFLSLYLLSPSMHTENHPQVDQKFKVILD